MNPTDQDLRATILKAMQPYIPNADRTHSLMLGDIVRDVRALIGDEPKPE